MDSSPTGLVTFLFTDIEGSTRLAQDFPDDLQIALDKHHKIIDNAFASNNGFVFDIVGDAFYCAFHNTEDAVRAAVQAQLDITKESWNAAVIKVRMGIHTGHAELMNKNYMGYITLARSARIMSAAYGEQILISSDSYEHLKTKLENTNNALRIITRDGINAQITFRDLGLRRLKDLIQPMQMFQVIADGLHSEFPALKTLDARPNNLPIQLTSFIGREKELAEIKAQLSGTRILTLLGPGGTGKTRLALQAGADVIDEFENGVWIIELASLTEQSLLSQAIADALQIKEQPGLSLEKILIEHVSSKKILLLLDNCEHLIDACSQLSEKLLRNSPNLKIIATSREGLKCQGEVIYKVLSMKHPEPGRKMVPEQLLQYEAVRLFTERALSVNPSFRVANENASALAQICFQLDGIPLAIELAAVRTKMLTPETIRQKLNDRFKLLTGGKRTALPRQQTLKAMIDWSYDLLSENEKLLWRRLTVFSGRWTLEAAEEICQDELLDQVDILDLMNELTDKSIILYLENEGNFKMLETLRQYGQEKLNEDGETAKFYAKHLNYYHGVYGNVFEEYAGPELGSLLDKAEGDYPNIQSALNRSFDNGLKEEGCRLAISMGKFWELRGFYSEGRTWLEKFINDDKDISHESITSSKNAAAILAVHQGLFEVSNKYLTEVLKIYREEGNKKGMGNTLNSLGLNLFDLSEYEKAKIYLRESLSLRREVNNRIGIASTLNSLGLVAIREGDFINAKKFIEESLEIAIELNDTMYKGICYSNLAQIYDNLGDVKKAKEYFEKSLSLDIELGNKNGMCISLYNIGAMELNAKEFSKAEKFFTEGYELSKETGYKQAMFYSMTGLGQLALEMGDHKKSSEIFIETLNELQNVNDIQCLLICITNVAELKSINGDMEAAVTLISSAKKLYEDTGSFIEEKLQKQYDDLVRSAIVKIGEAKTDEATEAGKTISFEKIIELCKTNLNPEI